VKGAALSVVIIDKLPFAVFPTDPLLKARLAAIRRRRRQPVLRGAGAQAVIGLKQGVGRLIATRTTSAW